MIQAEELIKELRDVIGDQMVDLLKLKIMNRHQAERILSLEETIRDLSDALVELQGGSTVVELQSVKSDVTDEVDTPA
jgi:hypothetical protein